MAETITTFTGRSIVISEITADDIDHRDMAHALARVSRFGGHTVGVINVADHSIRVALALLRSYGPFVAIRGLLR